MASRSRLFSKIAKDVRSDGNLSATALSSDISFGATVYDSAGALPITGLTSGDQAWAGNRLYISNGSGWYNIALVNAAPRFVSITDSDGIETPYALSIEGTPITITLVGADSDGSGVSYSFTKDAGFDGLATITGTGSQYTVTPLSQDSATTTSGTVTFKVSDGISFDTSVNTFTLNFVSPLWKNVVASVGHSDGQGATTAAIADRSGNGYHPAITSASGYPAQGSFHPYLDNWSVYFDGADDYLSVAASPDFAYGTGDFTFECWINTDNSDYFSVWQNSGVSATANNSRYFFGVSTSGNISLSRHAGGGGIASTGGEVTTGVWHHIAAVRESGTVSLYCDGSRVATGTTGWNGFGISDGYEHTIGYRVTPNYGGGFISDLRILNGTALYSGTSYTVPTEPLTAITNTVLLTCQSNRFVDNSSSGRTVTPNNGPAVKAYNPFGQGSEYLRANNKGSVEFNGGTTYGLSTITSTGSNNFTIEAWVYPRAMTNNASPFGLQASGGGNAVKAYISTSDNQWHWISQWTGDRDSGVNVKLNEWTHLAFSKNGNDVQFYVNGIRTGFTGVSTMTNGQVIVGYNTGSSVGFDGYVADLKLISGGTAKYSRDANFSIPTEPVGSSSAELYLPMDNAYIYDKAGNGNILNNSSTVDSTYSKFGSFAYKGAQVPMPIGLEADKWTFEVWWRSNNDSFGHLNWYNASGSNVMAMDLSVSYGTHYGYRFGWAAGLSGNIGGVSFGGQFADGWEHIALVRSGNTIRFYQNGNYKTSVSIDANNITSSGGYFKLDTRRWYENAQFLVGVEKYTGTSGSFTLPTEEQGYGTQTTGAAS